jgi:hypothetical protein
MLLNIIQKTFLQIILHFQKNKNKIIHIIENFKNKL